MKTSIAGITIQKPSVTTYYTVAIKIDGVKFPQKRFPYTPDGWDDALKHYCKIKGLNYRTIKHQQLRELK